MQQSECSMDNETESKSEALPLLNKSQETSNAAVVNNEKLVPRKSSLVSAGNQRSRFQVAKVDFASIPEGNGGNESDDERPNGGSNGPTSGQSPTHHSNDHSTYDTHYLRSLRHYTREPLPRAAHYRDVRSIHTHLDRPTLDDLHNADADGYKSPEQRKKSEAHIHSGALKLGWIEGVFVRCLLNIWGVMLFIRLSWVVGEAGILQACLIILLASVVTILTTLSMSAICTNGEVKGGGAYYLISRSLGPEFGGAIGAIFSLANAVAVAMYVVGFAETVQEILAAEGFDQLSKINVIRIVGLISTTVLLAITVIGMEWESKTQMVLLVILLAAIADFIVGSFLPPSDTQMYQGFLGYDSSLITENFWADFRKEDFISLFAIFFPAATGILAGANISGDLADPSKSLPKGTLLAILVTTATYLLLAVISGAVSLRDANGVEFHSNDTKIFVETVRNCSLAEGGVCKYGLQNNLQVMKLVSVFGPVIYAGIFAATLSSALASLVSAPKVFQALCKDNLFPYIKWFARGYGKSGEPRRAYLLTYFIAVGCVLIGDLNLIAPIISNFFLAAYCLINFSCFHASCTNSPGFRPSFKYYNKWVSLLGAILCLTVMFTMRWWTALFTFALIMFIYSYISYRKPDVNWGSSTQAETYLKALKAVVRMNNVAEHVKTFRPQLLVLTGRPPSRAPLLDFAHLITKKISLLVCGHIEASSLSLEARSRYLTEANTFFRKRKIDAFYELKTGMPFAEGARALMELSGIGKLRPNIVFMGYKNNWQDCAPEEVAEYFKIIHSAFDIHMSVAIFRLQEGFDYTEYADGIAELLTDSWNKRENGVAINMPSKDGDASLPRKPSSNQLSVDGAPRGISPPPTPVLLRSKMISEAGSSLSVEYRPQSQDGKSSNEKEVPYEKADIPKEIIFNINRFTQKQKHGTIDVWWLYDDGGLTMLIPYILTTRSQWSSCNLRVFTLANRKDELDQEKRNMASLLSKFRIDFSDVMVIPDIVKPPQEQSLREFESLIEKYREPENCEGPPDNAYIKESDLLALKEKTKRHIRLRELLLQHSTEANLIVMTFSVPRKGTCTAPLFMAWLETLTKDMPPFLLVRGNQASVLTFYS